MKIKKLLAILLSAVMVLPVLLTGCSSEEDEITENSIRQNITLNMYILTEEETDPEQAKAVQMAINEILLPDYKTTMKINYLTADNYWSEIEKMELETIEYNEKLEAEAEAARQAAKEANKNANKNNKKDEEEEVDLSEVEAEIEEEFNELVDQVFEQDDIILENPQIDIFLVNDPQKYAQLIEQKRIAPIDQYITLENKELTSYIYPTFLVGAKLGTSSTYGIPVNKAIGQYEYFVFDKALLDKYGMKAEDMKTFESLGQYLSVIKANEPGVVPLAHAAAPQFFEYYGEEGSALGVLDYQMIVSSYGEGADSVVKSHYKTVRNYKHAGYIPDTYTAGTRFAVDVRKGYAYSPDEWEQQDGREYETVVYKAPVATNNNTLDSVFVVSSLCKNPSRAVEVIKLLTTDPEITNLLQYGVSGTHYYFDSDTQTVNVNQNAGYFMNTNYTGNAYIKYPLKGEVNHKEDYIRQNLDSIASLYYCFVPALSAEDAILLEKANAISLRYYPGLLGGIYDVDSVFADINAQLNALTVSDTEIEAYYEAHPEFAPSETEENDVEGAPTQTPDVSEEDVTEQPGVADRPEGTASSAYEQMVLDLDEEFLDFVIGTPASSGLTNLQQKSLEVFNPDNANNYTEDVQKSDILIFGDEIEEEPITETKIIVDNTTAESAE